MPKMKIGVIQMLVGIDKPNNISNAIAKIEEAAKNGAELIVLPESFNSPYGTQYFKEYAETIPGQTTASLSKIAKALKISLVGGSIPEYSPETQRLHNTCPLINKHGDLVGKFRKMHMFDIDVPGKITFKESDSLSAGNELVIFKHGLWNCGIGICYDVRFLEFAEIYVQNDCNLLIYPSAFNMTTGPAHWQLMARARALQSQCYLAMCSPARNVNADYVAWGHSMIVDPWGEVLASAEEGEDIIYAEIDTTRVDEVRNMIPLRKQRRTDVYDTINHAKPKVLE